MSIFNWFRGLFGQVQTAEHPGLNDSRVPKAISSLMSHVSLSAEMNKVEGTGAQGPVMQSATQFKELHEAYPDCPELHYAYAAALQIALQGETAEKVLARCVETHPSFWLAKATLQQKALQTWNPFFLPEFSPESSSPVHPIIQQIVRTNILLATRRGVLPRAVLFLRDGGDEFPVSKLKTCKIEFLTTISDIKSPQVVAINGRVHDDPTNPFQCEITQCPFRPFGNRDRLPYELFVRQDTFDFVILDNSGRIKHVRLMRPSNKSKIVHARLADMLEKTAGPELNTSEVLNAQRRHQAVFDPKKILY